jgi:ankyrin repeat protein
VLRLTTDTCLALKHSSLQKLMCCNVTGVDIQTFHCQLWEISNDNASQGGSPIHYASQRGHADVVSALIRAGASTPWP